MSLNKTNTCFDHGLPTLHIRVLNTLVPKSLEPNKLPIWQSVTKQTKRSKFTKKSPLQKNSHYNKFNPNYYPSVASVDSNSIELTCIFPETLNKMHKRIC